jgi:outer membrane immunogenic protein
MRHIAMLLLSAVAFAGLSTGAEAAAKKKAVLKAKPITKAPPATTSSSGGTGFYVGINGGYDWGRVSFSEFPFTDTTIRARSGMAGLTFGYNAQAGAIVYGLETDIAAAWMKSSNWGVPPCFACEVQMRYFGTVRGRLGYAVGQSLPFITGGLAYGGLRTSNPFSAITEKDTRVGWTVGGGIEYAVAGAWSVKAEYLYYELDGMNCGTFVCGSEIEVKFKGNLVRAGTNFRF